MTRRLGKIELAVSSRRLIGAVFDLCYPRGCADCGGEMAAALPVSGALVTDQLAPAVCRECRASYLASIGGEAATGTFCQRCGSFAQQVDVPGIEGCRRCANWKRSGVAGVVPLGPYEGRLREAVLRMKLPTGDGLARALADVLWQTRGEWIRRIEVDAVVPVPMHRWRRLTRGISSAERIAARLGKNWGVEMGRRVLVRRRNTLPQGGLTAEGRRRNVRGALAVTAGYDLRGLRIALVDDVMTTGATVNEAARVLRRAGAASVHALVIARTDHPA
ncbi:MAG: ComF family protein [Planctomycetales bacterium]|nr:ComF family protein [Planctomycetales bacterium]